MPVNRILITGAAGFIGFHLVKKLIERGDYVVGIDNINDYYDVSLKYGRLKETGIRKHSIEYNQPLISDNYTNYKFVKLDLEDRINIEKLFKSEWFDIVVNLAAQAGVRHSLMNPHAYIDSNISGFMNILECCRKIEIKHLIFASSSSVYGLNTKYPFSTRDRVDHPISLYAATKKANELMAHSYSYLYDLPSTGLRFFTVYGPWGRPDMALFLFTKAILEGKPIRVFNYGNMKRDFTYIDDVVNGITCVIDNALKPNTEWSSSGSNDSASSAPYRIYNIASNCPVTLSDFIKAIEYKLGKKAIKKFLPMQPGDVKVSHADVVSFIEDFHYEPKTEIQVGISHFIGWYKEFYHYI